MSNLTVNQNTLVVDPIVDLSQDYYNDIFPDILNIFPLKKKLLNHIKFNKAIQILSKSILQIPDVQRLRTNFDLVKRIADLIENFLFKSKSVDKKALLISTFQNVFKLNSAEISIISDFIEFIHSNKLIKKLTTSQFLYYKSKKVLGSFLKL